jgi:hypothetical protein
MLKRSLIIIAAIVTVINLSWDASAQSLLKKMFGRMHIDNISQAEDKDIVKIFFKVSPTGTIEGWLPELAGKNSYLIALEKDGFCVERSVLRLLRRSPDPKDIKPFYEEDSDDIAQKYIAMAKTRNNVVRLYKPKMGAIVSRLFKKPFANKVSHERNSVWYDRNRVLMEFDKSGKIVSVLVRAMFEPENYIYQYSTLYFGDNVDRHLVNNIKNSAFQEYFIKEL